MREWSPDSHTTITYDPDVNAFYVSLSSDQQQIQETVTLQDSPVINVDYVDGRVVGVEILLPSRRAALDAATRESREEVQRLLTPSTSQLNQKKSRKTNYDEKT